MVAQLRGIQTGRKGASKGAKVTKKGMVKPGMIKARGK